MGNLLERIKSVFADRRHRAMQVAHDRRGKRIKIQDADAKLRESIDKLEQTAIMRREDFLKHLRK